ncbi:MAG: STAS domain-containing protein [SAR324 cluster bacterium]|nr:STAS domain-containing protein [SAR324 cluster bacterium]
MPLQHGITNGICVIDIDEIFTWELKDLIKKYVDQLLSDSKHTFKGLILNFEKVNFIDSQLLGTLILVYKRTTQQGLKFGLCCLSDTHIEVFKMSKLDLIINIYPSEEDAMDALSR